MRKSSRTYEILSCLASLARDGGIFYGPVTDIMRVIAPESLSSYHEAADEARKIAELIRKEVEKLRKNDGGPFLQVLEIESLEIKTSTPSKHNFVSTRWVLYVEPGNRYRFAVERIANSVTGITKTKIAKNAALFELYFCLFMLQVRRSESFRMRVEQRLKYLVSNESRFFKQGGKWAQLPVGERMGRQEATKAIAYSPIRALKIAKEFFAQESGPHIHDLVQPYALDTRIKNAPLIAYRHDILEEVERFVNDESLGRVFLLTASPGFGKSSIIQTFIKQELQRGRKHVHFLIRKNDGERNIPSRIMTRIAADIFPAVEARIAATVGEAVETFRRAASRLPNRDNQLIIIDGIDESYPNELNEPSLAEILPQILDERNCRFVLTSRPTANLADIDFDYRMEIENNEKQRDALQRFIDDYLEVELSDEAMEELLSASQGSFLYVELATTMFNREGVKSFLPGMPSGLDRLLDEEWKRVIKTPISMNDAVRLLALVGIVRCPIELATLAAVSRISLAELYEFLNVHGFLFRQIEDPHSNLTHSFKIGGYIHSAILEHFTTNKIGEHDMRAAHQSLIDYYRQQCSLPDDWNSGPRDEYFCRYLPSHLLGAGRRDELSELLIGSPRWLSTTLKTIGGELIYFEHLGLYRSILQESTENNHTRLVQVFLITQLCRSSAPPFFGNGVVALFDLGRVKEAIRHALITPDPIQRVRNLTSIARSPNCGLDTTKGLVEIAEKIASSISGEYYKLMANVDIFRASPKLFGVESHTYLAMAQQLVSEFQVLQTIEQRRQAAPIILQALLEVGFAELASDFVRQFDFGDCDENGIAYGYGSIAHFEAGRAEDGISIVKDIEDSRCRACAIRDLARKIPDLSCREELLQLLEEIYTCAPGASFGPDAQTKAVVAQAYNCLGQNDKARALFEQIVMEALFGRPGQQAFRENIIAFALAFSGYAYGLAKIDWRPLNYGPPIVSLLRLGIDIYSGDEMLQIVQALSTWSRPFDDNVLLSLDIYDRLHAEGQYEAQEIILEHISAVLEPLCFDFAGSQNVAYRLVQTGFQSLASKLIDNAKELKMQSLRQEHSLDLDILRLEVLGGRPDAAQVLMENYKSKRGCQSCDLFEVEIYTFLSQVRNIGATQLQKHLEQVKASLVSLDQAKPSLEAEAMFAIVEFISGRKQEAYARLDYVFETAFAMPSGVSAWALMERLNAVTFRIGCKSYIDTFFELARKNVHNTFANLIESENPVHPDHNEYDRWMGLSNLAVHFFSPRLRLADWDPDAPHYFDSDLRRSEQEQVEGLKSVVETGTSFSRQIPNHASYFYSEFIDELNGRIAYSSSKCRDFETAITFARRIDGHGVRLGVLLELNEEVHRAACSTHYSELIPLIEHTLKSCAESAEAQSYFDPARWSYVLKWSSDWLESIESKCVVQSISWVLPPIRLRSLLAAGRYNDIFGLETLREGVNLFECFRDWVQDCEPQNRQELYPSLEAILETYERFKDECLF